MQTKIIEASQPGDELFTNWGKFAVMRFDAEEWERPSIVCPLEETPMMRQLGMGTSLLAQRGWGPDHIIVFDIETCEGAGFNPDGSAHHDLIKHCVWVCPLFEPFLAWLYTQDLTDISALPDHVLVEAEFDVHGYRRPGIDLVGLSEIREMRGFTKSRARQLVKQPGFPEPAVELVMGRAWYRIEVEEFFRERYSATKLREAI